MAPITPRRFRKVVAAAGVSLVVIVLTGAAVRLTEAGLGCEDWPACSEDRFVPELALHPWIEFGNRLISGVVALAVIAAALTAYRRQPRRPDLIAWSWGLVIGVAAQVVLGGITVRVDLHPAFVGAHFLLSMVLLWNALVLWVKADASLSDTASSGTSLAETSMPEPRPLAVGSAVGPIPVPVTATVHGRLMVGLATLVLISGTLVTGTGPNGGDSRAERLNFDLSAIAQIHSITVWCFLALTVVLVLRLKPARSSARDDGLDRAFNTGQLLIVATIAQGAIGYLQFAVGVPPVLVGLHIFGAITVWCLSVLLYLRLFERSGLGADDRPEPASAHRQRTGPAPMKT